MELLYKRNKKNYIALVNTKIGIIGGFLSISKIAKQMDEDKVYTISELDSLDSLNSSNDSIKHYVRGLFNNINRVDRNRLMVNKVGVYSMTKYTEAVKTLDVIANKINLNNAIIIDATSGIGGNILNMFNRVKFIYGYELCKTQYDILSYNCSVYGLDNVTLFNEDYTKNINREKADILLLDPPWGGLDYKKEKTIVLKLGDMTISQIIDMANASIIVVKLPFNHDTEIFKNYSHTIHTIGNYIIVIIDKTKSNSSVYFPNHTH